MAKTSCNADGTFREATDGVYRPQSLETEPSISSKHSSSTMESKRVFTYQAISDSIRPHFIFVLVTVHCFSILATSIELHAQVLLSPPPATTSSSPPAGSSPLPSPSPSPSPPVGSVPSQGPSMVPGTTVTPTSSPSVSPSLQPTAAPTSSAKPTVTASPSPKPSDDGREWMDIDESGISEDGYITSVEMTEANKKGICRKYEGKYISHYDKVFLVKSCSAFEISDQDELYELLQKKRISPQVVDAETMRALVKKVVMSGVGKKVRTCKQLDRKYVTLDGLDIYYVESCKKRLFLDYQSFNEHREKLSERSPGNRIVEKIDYKEFKSLKNGEDMTSVLNKEYAQYLRSRGQKEIEIISVEEACAGLEGKIVSYTDRLYKIEKCHKVQLDASEFTRKNPERTFKEISSEIWISLPDALPKPTPKAKGEQ